MSTANIRLVSQPPPDDTLMTIGEVSQMTRVPEGTLRYWRHCHVGPHSFKLGRRVFYWRSDVVEWLRRQARGEDVG